MKKNRRLFLLVLLPLVLSAWPGGNFGKRPLVVDATPSWFGFSNCEGFSWRSTYDTIQEAVDVAQNGDTIKICKGEYNEQVTVWQDNLTITGGRDVSTPTDVNWRYHDDVLKIGDDNHNNKVKNLTVQNISLHSTSRSFNSKAIRMYKVENKITLRNLVIKTDGADALWGGWNVEENTKGIFENLTIESKGSGIVIAKGALQTFENIDFTLSSGNGNHKAIKLDTGVQDKDHRFKHLSFDLSAEPAMELSSGKSMVFQDINISATKYSDDRKAFGSDYNVSPDANFLFEDIHIKINRGVGIYIDKGKNIDAHNVVISGTTNYGAFFIGDGATGNLSFDHSQFDVNGDYGLQVKRGKDLTIRDTTIRGSSGNGWGIKTDWGVVGNYDFRDVKIDAHAGGIYIAKGKQVVFENVKVTSDSRSANDVGIRFHWGNFERMEFSNCEVNATGNALQIAGSQDLSIDACRLTTYGDKALSISTNVRKALIQNSCFYNASSSKNSYALWCYNWQNDLHFNHNCFYAPNGGNYASDTKAHDWSGNYWDGVSDINGDGKIDHTDSGRIGEEIVDEDFQSVCQNSCAGASSLPQPLAEWRMDACRWQGIQNEVKDASENGYHGRARNGVNTEDAQLAGGGICRVGKFDGKNDYIEVPTFPHLMGSRSITAWFRTRSPQKRGQRIFADDEKNRKGCYALSVGDPGGGKVRFYIRGLNRVSLDTHAVVEKDRWYFVAATFDAKKMIKRVVIYDTDGNKIDEVSAFVRGHLVRPTGKASVGGETDEGERSNRFWGNLDEVKVFDTLLSPQQIVQIYQREKEGRNLDGSVRSCAVCPGDGNGTMSIGFDAWDTFRNIGDRNISTKISARSFSLTIASLDRDGNTLKNFNGSVCARIVRKVEKTPLSLWVKKQFREVPKVDMDFIVHEAAKEAAVEIVWKKDVDETCPLKNEENRTVSTDAFAIRPSHFLFSQPGKDANLTAEHHYSYPHAIKAVGVDGSVTQDYNTTVMLRAKKRMRNGEINASMAGRSEIFLSAFADGVADLNLSFDNVAILTLELNDTQWASVDADDTPDADRAIYAERNVTFIPHHFRVEFLSTPKMEDNDSTNGFTYLSNDLRMSGWVRDLSVKISAEGEKGGLMTNFANPMDRLYADPVDVIPLLHLPKKHSSAQTQGEPQPQNGVDLSFESGEALLSYTDVAFNYRRTYDDPIDPFHIDGSEGNISVMLQDTLYPSVTGNVLSDFIGGATFYFGRLRAEDVQTSEKHVENLVELEVYGQNAPLFVTGFRQNSLHWYRNEKHRSPMNGGILEANVTLNTKLSSPSDPGIRIGTRYNGNGTVTMEINTTQDLSRKRIIHLEVDSWLWYVPRGFGRPYAYDGASDCAQHPCFNYIYTGRRSHGGVQSGEINGSDFEMGTLDANTTIQRRQGVKVFR